MWLRFASNEQRVAHLIWKMIENVVKANEYYEQGAVLPSWKTCVSRMSRPPSTTPPSTTPGAQSSIYVAQTRSGPAGAVAQ